VLHPSTASSATAGNLRENLTTEIFVGLSAGPMRSKKFRSVFLAHSCSKLLFCCLAIGIALPAMADDAHSIGWMQIAPPTSPSARSYPAMTYDPVSRKVIMFGGFDGASYLADTWMFDGITWTRADTPVAPPARVNCQMAFDVVTHKVVLFGGYNRTYLGDTWLWDGRTLQWTQATPLHSPPAVTGPMIFNDPSGRVDEFGGFDGRFYQATMWQWNGADWIRLFPPTVPYARSSAAVGLNPFTGELVMFGGLADVNPANTWTYNGTTWTMQSPSTQPPLVYGPSAAFDRHLNAVVVFGGASGGAAQNSSWRWIGNDWHHLRTTHLPPHREGAGIAYDLRLDRLVIFGGQHGNTYLDDTWQFNP
jgi:hypothetical protein